MVTMKKRARQIGTKKFVLDEASLPVQLAKLRHGHPKVACKEEVTNNAGMAFTLKCLVGCPKASDPKLDPPLTTFEVNIKVSVGGSGIDRAAISHAQRFSVEKTLVEKCTLERDETTFHLHLQMVAQVKSLIAILKLLKTYLGWDANKPAKRHCYV